MSHLKLNAWLPDVAFVSIIARVSVPTDVSHRAMSVKLSEQGSAMRSAVGRDGLHELSENALLYREDAANACARFVTHG